MEGGCGNDTAVLQSCGRPVTGGRGKTRPTAEIQEVVSLKKRARFFGRAAKGNGRGHAVS